VTKLFAIVGPTASGKTRMGIEVALALAEHGPRAEIVSCDSMAVYRGLDIAADKPPKAERLGVPPHLFDIADSNEDVTAVRYRELARAAIADISERGAVPVLVGGSGLWFRAVVDDLEFAPTSPEVRKRLEAEDPDELYRRLSEADPKAAERVDRRNVRRVVRAVEILELTGRPPSELRDAWDRRSGPYDLSVCGLGWNRDELYRRGAQRVQREIDAGLVDEVRTVLARGISRTAQQALGVKEIAAFVEGRLTIEEATELLVRNTKNFVRKQLSWFAADPRVDWVNVSRLGWDAARRAVVDRFRATG
jgi:tRNA dimethylallyltransferase